MLAKTDYTNSFVNLPFWSTASHPFFIFTQFPYSLGITLSYFADIVFYFHIVHLYTLFTTSYGFILWLFRKLKLVKEVYKECKSQDIFDVILTAAIHHVFKRDLPSLEIAFNDSEVHLTLHAVYLTVAFRLVPLWLHISLPSLEFTILNKRPCIKGDNEGIYMVDTCYTVYKLLWSLFS